MKNESKNFLFCIAAIGLAALLLKRRKKDEVVEQDVGLGAIPNTYLKVGRVKSTIAWQAHIKAGDIVVTPNCIDHINDKHGKELRQLGISAIDYITMIANNFNQIRRGSGDSILLVVNNRQLNAEVAVQMTPFIDDRGCNVWEIHTSHPRRKYSSSRNLLWEKK